jgi:hypothetical protein
LENDDRLTVLLPAAEEPRYRSKAKQGQASANGSGTAVMEF